MSQRRSTKIQVPIHRSNPDLDHYLRSLSQRLDPSKVVKTSPASKPLTKAEQNLALVQEIFKLWYFQSCKQFSTFGQYVQPFQHRGSKVTARATYEFEVNLMLADTIPSAAFQVRRDLKHDSSLGFTLQSIRCCTRIMYVL